MSTPVYLRKLRKRDCTLFKQSKSTTLFIQHCVNKLTKGKLPQASGYHTDRIGMVIIQLRCGLELISMRNAPSVNN